ncbi:DUF2254 domain-containing protein [Botrimarina mediterranea]|uniref:DUF2254 domain-containing protein n=1 Tax=Botrimarina mediterranea TaxID=2528022 RepID=A0A518KAS8_9BACT|nr:DUF2254 domain-containing protein [Botrimarina mediterranea]QDV74890.1 hypothetical protein Spa11_30990 [Botrimarina mediterranea]QDV79533.1 hypothetical protein K2D_31480 [Planctomycetes bacterium K2D]
MRARTVNVWVAISSSFWFVPGLMMAAGVVLAVLLPEIDRVIQWNLPGRFQVSGETARTTISTLAGAMVTVTGIVFSTTTVAISITAAQHGPRLLRNFFAKSVTQATLGICLSVSVYCLLLLRTVDEREGEIFIPQISVHAAYLFVLVALVAIIFFTHQVASLMQTQNVASDVADELDNAVGRLYPDPLDDEAEEGGDSPAWRECWEGFDEESSQGAPSSYDGYVQAIDVDSLVDIATRRDVLLRIEARPGDYVRDGDRLVSASPGDRLEEDDAKRIRSVFMIGNLRTPQQDVECAVVELVEIAVRALSPGVNDPFTAITCIDRLSGTLRRLAGRKPAQSLWRDDDEAPRLVVKPRAFADVVDAAFNQIRQHCRSDVAVTVRLLQSIEAIASAPRNAESLAALRRQAEMILAGARTAGHTDGDIKDIEDFFGSAVDALAQNPASTA